MLAELAIDVQPTGEADPPALAWRRAGLTAVTGRADGPGLVCPAPLASVADGALMALRAIAPADHRLPESGAILLGERARLLGLSRRGAVSANGTCRLIDTADGRIALNLARADDRDLLPLWMGDAAATDWDALERLAARRETGALMAAGVELGLPLARDGGATRSRLFHPAPPTRREGEAPLVLDFSALWAGPLATSLLGMMGARVVKVESVARPDGARRGAADFYRLLNGGKQSVALDFEDASARAALLRLAARADIIVEASRPRALARLGLDRAAFVAAGGVWLSLTAHEDPGRVGFGDDAAVEGGIALAMARGWGEPMFAGDAVADPLAGIHAAVGAWAAWRGGIGRWVRLSLSGTVAHALGAGMAEGTTLAKWQQQAADDDAPLYAMRRNEPASEARAMGADNGLLA